MRVAILSDVHGNTIALDAILDDIRQQGGADAHWILGDLAAIGPDPIGALQRLSALPEARFVRGNCDRYLVTGERPAPSLEDAQNDPALLKPLVEVARSFAWTQGAVVATGWLPWMANLPLEFRAVLPDGTRVLAVHAAPGLDDGWGIHPLLAEAEIATQLSGCEADLVLVGHTHWALDLTVNGVRLANPGSLSNAFPPDLRAAYILLHSDSSGWRLEHRRVDYDREAVIVELERVQHPARRFLARWLRGEVRPRWQSER